MRRNVLRYSMWVGIALLLALVLMSGCTRSKSSGPPDATEETGEPEATQPPSAEATSAVEGDPISVTTTAWARETATAAARSAQATTPAPTATATKAAEPTSPSPTETPEPTEAPEPTEPPQATEPAATTEVGVHTVTLGENLFRIALEYGLTYQVLAAHNGIANPNLIYVGQELKIPSAGTTVTPPSQGEIYHVVQSGENLFRVALKYGLLFTVLAEANDLSYPYTIYPGQQLVIP